VPGPNGRTRIYQTALWDPVGLLGHAYWYSLWPLHQVVFRSIIRGIARDSAGKNPSGGIAGDETPC
jgi:hypothetical protein